MSNKEQFFAAYRANLSLAVASHPEEYLWFNGDLESIERTARLMMAAFERKSYNKDSRAIRTTCKQLGVKHTYTAINAFISEVR